MNTLRDKIVLITGAAGGFGRAIALATAEQGAHLALIDLDGRGLDDLASRLRAMQVQVHTSVVDLASAQGVQTGINAALAPYHQQIDVLVANVGVLVAGKFADITDGQLEYALTINYLTHVWACRAVLPLMQGRKGANIVLMGSDQGRQPDAGLYPYAQAKAALHSLAKLLAREYGPEIRVNAVSPGMSRTALVEGLIERLAREDFHTDRATAETLELQRRGVPLARLGEPEEVAEAVVFLACNGYCSGSILDISGGNVRAL